MKIPASSREPIRFSDVKQFRLLLCAMQMAKITMRCFSMR